MALKLCVYWNLEMQYNYSYDDKLTSAIWSSSMMAESESVAAWKSGSLLIELQFDWSSRFWRNKVSESTFIFPSFEFCCEVADVITSFVSEWSPLVLQNSNFSKKFGSIVDPFFWSRCLITFCCFNITYNGSEHQDILPIHARSIKCINYTI